MCFFCFGGPKYQTSGRFWMSKESEALGHGEYHIPKLGTSSLPCRYVARISPTKYLELLLTTKSHSHSHPKKKRKSVCKICKIIGCQGCLMSKCVCHLASKTCFCIFSDISFWIRIHNIKSMDPMNSKQIWPILVTRWAPDPVTNWVK